MLKKDYFVCPVCGKTNHLEKLGKHHDFVVKTKEIGKGKGNIKWYTKEIGNNKEKKKLLEVVSWVQEVYSTLNGCDWSLNCLVCERDLENCPDNVRGYGQKSELKERAEKVIEMKADQTLSTKEIAKKLGVNQRTIQRDIQRIKEGK